MALADRSENIGVVLIVLVITALLHWQEFHSEKIQITAFVVK
jgi:hypothetical protein